MMLSELSRQDAGALKRLRQRMRVRQVYRREKVKLKLLRYQVCALESQLTGLQITMMDIKPNDIKPNAKSPLVELVGIAVEEKRQLLEENEALEKEVDKRMRLENRLRYLLESYYTPILSPPPKPHEYRRVIASTLQNVLRSIQSIDYDQPATVKKSVLGWTSYQEHEEGHQRFVLRKNFHGASALELLAETWNLVSCPTAYAQLYSPHVRAQVRLLHVIDESTMLMFTELAITDDLGPTKAVYIVHRTSYAEGYIILMKSISIELLDPALNAAIGDVQRPELPEEADMQHQDRWADMFAWLVFENSGPRDCTFQLCGRSRSVWHTEVLMLAMRWQYALFGCEKVLPE